MGISEVEFLGSDGEPEPENEHDDEDGRTRRRADSTPQTVAPQTVAPQTVAPQTVAPQTVATQSADESVGVDPPPRRRPRLFDPVFRPRATAKQQLLARRWVTPATGLLAVLILAVAGGAYAVIRQQSRAADDFDVAMISAQYLLRQDASGIDLELAVQNTGATMVELTGVSVDQPGLIRTAAADQSAGLAEYEAGSPSVSPLGVGTTITPVALAPKDVEIVTVPFRYDCSRSGARPVTRRVALAGYSSRGTAHALRLSLPLTGATPWQNRDLLRDALCDKPSPQADLAIAYGGIGNTLMELSPVRFNYSITLTAPPDTSVTINSISQDNPGISASTDPGLPVTVLDGQSVRLTVSWRVMSCVIATSVHSADGVQITATASQSVQTWDAKLGAQFTKDLDAEISTVCSGG